MQNELPCVVVPFGTSIVMFCVGRPAATPRRHIIESDMCNKAREDGVGMHDDMDDMSRRDSPTIELDEGNGVMARLEKVGLEL